MVNPGSLAPDIYSGTVTIASSGAAGSVQAIQVTLAVSPAAPVTKINTTITSSLPNLVIDAKGNYNVVWRDSTAGVTFSRSTDQGVTFSTGVTIPGSAGAEFQPQFVVDASGNNIDVVWAQSASIAGSYNVLVSRSTDGGQNFATTPTTLTLAALPLADAPRITLEPNGGVDVAWGRNETWAIHSSDGVVFATPAVKISTAAQDSGGPRVVVDSKGTIYVAWTDEVNKLATGSYCLETATSNTSAFTNTLGGNFYFNITASGSAFDPNNTRNLSSTDWAGVLTKWQLGFFGCSYDNLILLVDSQDNLHMVWSDDMPDQDVLVSAYPVINSTGKSRVSFPNNVASSVAASPHAIVVNNSSGVPIVHVVWSDGPGDLKTQATAGIFYTHSTDTSAPFGQSFAPPTKVVNAMSEFPQVGIDGGGNVNVAWQQSDTSVANAFDVFLAASSDGGNTFATSMPVSPHPSNECLGTNTTDTTQIPPPPRNTCGSVQLKVDSTNESNLVWVDLNPTVSDILFSRATVAPPPGDFSASLASSSATSLQGQIASYTVNIGSAGGYNGSVIITCVGLTGGATCASSPTSVTPPGSATIAVTVPGTLAPGTYPFTIIATNGSTNHSQPATLTVGTINATVAPATSATIAVGRSANFTVSLTSTNGSAGPVSFACGGIASGLTCGFNPAQVNVPASGVITTTMTVTVTAKPASILVYGPPNVRPNPTMWSIAFSTLSLMAIMMLVAHRRNGARPPALIRGLAFVLVVVLGATLTSCAGLTSRGSGSSSTNSVTTQFTLQSHSGTATVNLGTMSITVP